MAASGRALLASTVLGVYILLALALAAWVVFMAVMFNDFFFVPAPATVVGAAVVALALPVALAVLLVAVLRGGARATGMALGTHAAVAGLSLLGAGVVVARGGGPRALLVPLALLAASALGIVALAKPARA